MKPEKFLQEERARVQGRVQAALKVYPAHATRDLERLKLLDWLIGMAPFAGTEEFEAVLRSLAAGERSVPDVWPAELVQGYAGLLLGRWAE